ncbi:MAG: Crp/Fnr family transcriptional regulator [Rhodospirillales bacterium]
MELKTLTEALRDHPFLEGMKPNHVQKMAEVAMEVQFSRDQVIFREGDESSLFCLLLTGKVALEVTAPGRIVRVQTLGVGDELGWSSLIGRKGKTFQARAIEPVRAIAFDGARLRHACEMDAAFGYQLMQRVLRVVAERLQATRLQLIDVFAPTGSKLV